MAMASSSLLLLLLLLSLYTLVSAGAIRRPTPPKGGFYGRASRKAAKDAMKDYLEQQAQQRAADMYNVPSQQNSGAGGQHQLGGSAADKAPALVFSLSIGTQSLSVIMDITSELVWALCSCNSAAADCLRTPETPFFQPPAEPNSFSAVDCATPTCQNSVSQICVADDDHCTYLVQYYESSDSVGSPKTSGYLATDTFKFGTIPVDNLVFGCSDSSTVDLTGASGSVGFNRGNLSIVSQLQLSSFSYLISSEQNKSFVAWSWEKGVPAVQPNSRSRSRSTPLLPPKATPIPNLYYVMIAGIEVDGQALPIPAHTFHIQVDDSGRPQSGGVILSTIHPVTYLEKDAYDALRADLVRRISAQGVNPVDPLDLSHLCYRTNDFIRKQVPTVALVFDGHDAKMELDVENYFFSLPADSPGASGVAQECLTILSSSGFSLLGSLLQTDMNMTYDMDRGLLTFDKAVATAVAPATRRVTATAASAFPMSLAVKVIPLLLLICMIFF